VAVINATDLSPIMEHIQVKEIRELVAPENKTSIQPVEISLKVADLPTITPIEANTRNGTSTSTVKSVCFCLCRDLFNSTGLADTENIWPYPSSVVGLDYICISSLTDDYYSLRSSQYPCMYLLLLTLGMANLYVMYVCNVNLVFNHQHFMRSTMKAYSVTASYFYGVK